MNDMIACFRRLIQPIKAQIAMIASRAVVSVLSDDEGIQTLKAALLADEQAEGIERFQNFGVTSVPPADSEALIIFPLGNREHGICVAVDNRDARLTGLAPGEVALYNTNKDKWHLKAGGTLEGQLSENLEVALKKLKFENDQGELIDLLVQTLDAIAVEPFIVNKGTFATIKTKLESFKV